MSNYTFASMPSVSIARSKFVRPLEHNNSFNLGDICVLGCDEVIPGSTHKLEIGSLIRMSTPIAPIMSDIQFDIFSFFVPCRLTWEHWKNFMGESDQAGIATTTYTIPQQNIFGSIINTTADDLGIFPDYHLNDSVNATSISILPLRAIPLIYNRFFRNQNVEAPLVVSTGDTVSASEWAFTSSGIVTDGTGTGGGARLKAYKLPDYITSSLPYAQKGDPVKILKDDLPVVTGNVHGSSGVDYIATLVNGSARSDTGYLYTGSGNGTVFGETAGSGLTGDPIVPGNLWAKCTNTINDLRFAFQLQKALEKDALYGSRYWEVLRAHYAVTSPDATLQDPELLGHIKFDINISQVLQTTGFTSPSSTNLGTPGANSVTANKGHVFTASFVEHGYLITIGVARQKRHVYSASLSRMWSRTERWDFYHPVFANIGAQKVLKKEVFALAPTAGNDVFGYQEAWAEYRFQNHYNSGLLNPYRANSLDYWTLADKYASMPTLSQSFLVEDRSNLIRALVTGAAGPDFIGSFYLKDTVVNPMPLYSIPGFADHH